MPLLEKGFTADDLRQFVVLASDKANQPVLVHCEFGSTRTGMAVAAYRVLVDKWTVDQAVAEADHYRFNTHYRKELVDALQELARPAAATLPAGEAN